MGQDLLFIDAHIPHGASAVFTLRARPPLSGLLAQSVPVSLAGVFDETSAEWRVPRGQEGRLRALAAETRAVVLPRAARWLDVPFAMRVSGALVPKPLWGGVFASLGADRFDELTQSALTRACHRCDACGRVASSVHTDIDYSCPPVAVARRLVVLCDGCGLVAHHGRARVQGCAARSLVQARLVNGWSKAVCLDRFSADAREWLDRSRVDWVLDVSALM
jgi:hypothetical protein